MNRPIERSESSDPVMSYRPGCDSTWLSALAWLLPVAAFANAAAYIAYAGNPLVASDAWYFINAFLQKAIESGPELQDFFVKRDALDHAQPLLKGLLLINARWLGLDFVFEALMGLLFAAAMLFFVMRTTREDRAALQPQWLRALELGALGAALVTLNAGMVFNWSLVTLVYLSYLLAVIAAAAAWRALTLGRYRTLALVALLIAFTQDDVGMIISAVLIIAAMLAAAKQGQWRRGVVVAAVLLASESGYLIVSHLLFEQGLVGSAEGGGKSGNLLALWAHSGESLEIARIVLGSTLAHLNTLLHYSPESAVAWQGILAACVAIAHAWFWWRAWRCDWNLPVFYAVVVMLLFYAMTAGVLYARVPQHGINYLHEPRYVSFYLLSNVALVLMLMGQPFRATKRSFQIIAGASLAALVAWQVPLSRFTWHDGHYLGAYYHTMARQMLDLGTAVAPQSCVPLLTVCDMPPAEQANAIQFLKRHELNIYSRAFVERYRLERLVPSEPASSGE
ncbi:MAG: hypothetical protein ABWX88_02790 [Pseudoxanthomonas sp.]